MSREPAASDAARRMKGLVEWLAVSGTFSDWGTSDFYLREKVAADEFGCINSWRLRMFINNTSLEPPNFSHCWRSTTYDNWENEMGGLYYFSLPDATPRAERYTKVMAVVGKGVPFTEFIEGRVQIKDLPSDSIVVIEVSQSKVPWMQAGDLALSELEAAAKEGDVLGTGVSSSGRLVAFADGGVWLLDKSTPIAALLPFCTVTGAEKKDRERELKEYVVKKF